MDDWVYGKSLGYTGSPGDYVIALEAVQKQLKKVLKMILVQNLSRVGAAMNQNLIFQA